MKNALCSVLSLVQVSYSADLFLEKNKDFVVMEHQALLGNSRDPFVAGLFPAPEGDRAKTKFTSLGTSFKVSPQRAIRLSYCIIQVNVSNSLDKYRVMIHRV